MSDSDTPSPPPEAAPPSGPERRRSGPRPAKRAQILRAAAAVFLRDGFGPASVDAITLEAGVSKRTLYAHFPSKERLFEAIVGALCDEILRPLDAAAEPGAPLRDLLLQLGQQYLDAMLSPGGLDLYRLVVAEAKRFPALGELFYARAHERAAAALADHLARHAGPGVDARFAAEGFFMLVAGFTYERALLRPDVPMSRAGLRSQLEQAVDLFLVGLAGAPRP